MTVPSRRAKRKAQSSRYPPNHRPGSGRRDLQINPEQPMIGAVAE